MRSVRYIGRHAAVEIETAPGRARRVARGDTIELPDRVVDRLLDQTANWADPDRPTVPDGTVDEVAAWVDGNPERAAAALAAERDGKARQTLLSQLEQIVAGTPAGDATDAGDGTKEG